MAPETPVLRLLRILFCLVWCVSCMAFLRLIISMSMFQKEMLGTHASWVEDLFYNCAM